MVMKSLFVLFIIFCIFNLTLCEHNHRFQKPTFKRHNGQDPKNDANSCIVDPNFTSCFSNTCPTLSACLNYLNGYNTMNVFFFATNFTTCPSTFKITKQVQLNLDAYNDGEVLFNCAAQNGNFLNLTATRPVSLSIQNIAVVGGNTSPTPKGCISLNGGSSTAPNSISFNNVTIQGCNTISNSGAAIQVNGYYQLSVSNSEFTHNNAEYANGGAILSIVPGMSVNITSSRFSKNLASSGRGGAIYADSISIINSEFTSNQANEGGAVFSLTSQFSENSVYSNNEAVARGGAVGVTGSLSIISNSFENNTAYYGGHINIDSVSSIEIINSLLRYGSGQTGSAVHLDNNPGTMYFNGSLFEYNTAQNGGATIFSLGFLSMYAGVFENNRPYTFSSSFLESVNSVNVSSGENCLSRPYLRDSGICVDVEGPECINGEAFVDLNGFVESCNCYASWYGSTCDYQEESSESYSSASESSVSESSNSSASESESSSASESSESYSYASSEEPHHISWEWIVALFIILIAIALLIEYVIKHIFTDSLI